MADFQKFVDFLSGLSTTKVGAKRADRIFLCSTKMEESGYKTMGWSCRDSMCPRCRTIVALRAHERLACFPKVSYMVTCTWRESGRWGALQEEAFKRSLIARGLAKSCGVQMMYWTTEFTASTERIHLHLHTVQTGEQESAEFVKYFNSVGERFADRTAYNGNASELAKYLTPEYSNMVGRLLAETSRFRTRGSYGTKAKGVVNGV